VSPDPVGGRAVWGGWRRGSCAREGRRMCLGGPLGGVHGQGRRLSSRCDCGGGRRGRGIGRRRSRGRDGERPAGRGGGRGRCGCGVSRRRGAGGRDRGRCGKRWGAVGDRGET